MGRLISTAGMGIDIGSLPMINNGPDFIAADFNGVSWIEIGGHTNLGQAGDVSELLTSNQIAIARTRKAKGPRNAGAMQIVCDIDYTDPGQLACIAAERSYDTFPVRLRLPRGAPKASTVTMTIASPGVVSWATHGFVAGDGVRFATTGTLPTGVVAGQTYYVIAAGLTAGTFQFSATVGGAAVATTGTQTGVHTAQSVGGGPIRLFTALVMQAQEQFNEANAIMKFNTTLEIDSNYLRA